MSDAIEKSPVKWVDDLPLWVSAKRMECQRLVMQRLLRRRHVLSKRKPATSGHDAEAA